MQTIINYFALLLTGMFLQALNTVEVTMTNFSNDTGVNESYFGNNQRDYISTPRTIGMRVGYVF